MQTESNVGVCSRLASELFPLKFWRSMVADTAQASFGIIFFVVEITKGYCPRKEI
jgi:hypothetical protein